MVTCGAALKQQSMLPATFPEWGGIEVRDRNRFVVMELRRDHICL
jgi:hypothetical protein